MERLEADWAGRTVYLIGGGPSLKGFDFQVLRGRGIVVAINDAILAAPWADVAFSIDTVWIRNRVEALRDWGGEFVAAVPQGYEPPEGVRGRFLQRKQGTGVSPLPWIIMTGDNSGYAALSMALMRGAARVALLGYDMTTPGHWHEGYNWRSRYGARDYPRWAAMFGTLAVAAKARGVDVVNCNPQSRVRAFRFGQPLEIAEPQA
ncbi:hypothetical protein [Alsobacter sp. R-9]